MAHGSLALNATAPSLTPRPPTSRPDSSPTGSATAAGLRRRDREPDRRRPVRQPLDAARRRRGAHQLRRCPVDAAAIADAWNQPLSYASSGTGSQNGNRASRSTIRTCTAPNWRATGPPATTTSSPTTCRPGPRSGTGSSSATAPSSAPSVAERHTSTSTGRATRASRAGPTRTCPGSMSSSASDRRRCVADVLRRSGSSDERPVIARQPTRRLRRLLRRHSARGRRLRSSGNGTTPGPNTSRWRAGQRYVYAYGNTGVPADDRGATGDDRPPRGAARRRPDGFGLGPGAVSTLRDRPQDYQTVRRRGLRRRRPRPCCGRLPCRPVGRQGGRQRRRRRRRGDATDPPQRGHRDADLGPGRRRTT